MVRCSTLRCITDHYDTLRRVAFRSVRTCYGTLRHVTVRYGALRYLAVRYGSLWHAAALRYGAIRHVTARCDTMQHIMVFQSTAARYGVLRHVTERCGMHVAARYCASMIVTACYGALRCSMLRCSILRCFLTPVRYTSACALRYNAARCGTIWCVTDH